MAEVKRNIGGAITELNGVKPTVKIPGNSGLQGLANSFNGENSANSVTPQAIRELFADFCSLIETFEPETRKKAMQKLIDGNEDVVDTLAHIKLRDYKEAIKNKRNLSRDESAQNGFKKFMAERLTQDMGNRIREKYERESVGPLMDLPFALFEKAPEILSKGSID